MSILEVAVSFRYESGFAIATAFVISDPVTGLVGPSGAGKTTILSLIAGLLKPTSGKIQLADRVLFDSAKGINIPPNQRRIGYVFQDYQLFPHLTVEQNLRYGQRRTRKVDIDFARVVQVLRLQELLSRGPNSLSGGQKQRVALGRAVLVSPELLLLDEPLSAVDEAHRNELVAFLDCVTSEFAIPTILVSHDTAVVEALTKVVVRVEAPPPGVSVRV